MSLSEPSFLVTWKVPSKSSHCVEGVETGADTGANVEGTGAGVIGTGAGVIGTGAGVEGTGAGVTGAGAVGAVGSHVSTRANSSFSEYPSSVAAFQAIRNAA